MDHLNKKVRIFLIGIGGIGMSGIAEILHNLGYEVVGSDQKEGLNVIRLKKLGIKIKIGHSASNIQGSSLVVYSSAIKKQNIEIKEALKIKVPLISRAEMLAELMRMKKTITVAGSHGKTTTISIISEIFVKSELDPTVVNGGIINSLGSNTRLGLSDWMIVETDESDGSFVKLPSFCGLITSIDDEHIDFYNNMTNLENAFEQYINNISVFGFSVICSDDDRLYKIATQQKRSDQFFYGTNARANYKAKNIRINKQGQTFDIEIKNKNEKRKLYKNIQFPMHGRHNLLNALGAITISHRAGVSFKFIRQALRNFEGVKRRMTLLKTSDNRQYFDDYAHHPTEIKASLRALRHLSGKRIITVVQPHRFSRIKQTFDKFSKSFENSDLVIVLPVYAAGEKKIKNINTNNLAKSIQKNSKTKTLAFNSFNKVKNFLDDEVKKDEIVIFMGAGNISELANNYVNNLGKVNV
tara:strand:- start:826 stop:2229 length:1404 start_codon:yes stop_codon:yes gene_type:complete